jgi:biopolymer transport protein ExbD
MLLLKPRNRRSELRFEVIPIIDVLFTLLIFFVIFSSAAAAYFNQKGMKMQLPSAATVSTEKKSVVVTIDGAMNYFLDGEAILPEEIREKIKTLLGTSTVLQVMISADKSVTYDRLIFVLDEVRLGGCYDVVLQADKKII